MLFSDSKAIPLANVLRLRDFTVCSSRPLAVAYNLVPRAHVPFGQHIAVAYKQNNSNKLQTNLRMRKRLAAVFSKGILRNFRFRLSLACVPVHYARVHTQRRHARVMDWNTG